MEQAKADLLFGGIPEGYDLDDPDDWGALIDASEELPVDGLGKSFVTIVTEQVAAGDPPIVWETAQRLLGLGLDRSHVMRQLMIALARTVSSSFDREDESFDISSYASALESLPLPDPSRIFSLAIELATSGGVIGIDALEKQVIAGLASPADPELVLDMVDRVFERLVGDGPLALLAGDLVVHVPSLTERVVLTHRLSGAEKEREAISLGFDLAAFASRQVWVVASGEELTKSWFGSHQAGWFVPSGWLDDFDEGSLLAVQVDGEGVVHVTAVTDEAPDAPEVVALLRAVYDDAVAEPWLPVPGEDLVLGMLARDPAVFDVVRQPLETLCALADLERRDDRVAHDDDVWRTQQALWQTHRVFDSLPDSDRSGAALAILRLAEHPEPERDEIICALGDLRDPDIAEVVVEELLEEVGEGVASRLSDALVAVAESGRQIGVARWIAARVAEAAGETLVADAHLKIALEADPSSGPVVERCAWYASDRGDAQEAVRLWRRLEDDGRGDIETVAPFTHRATSKVGRNEPCWCGSGRKSKACHPRQAPPIPLPERVGWLCRKATAYVEHAGTEARNLVMALAELRAVGDDEESLVEAFSDPIVIDAALTEGGWFELFLEDRGPLLPDDEALLARAWTLVARTVYEVVGIDPGTGLTLRDLRTGDELEVRERTFSRDARTGDLLCARAVPDGVTHQLVGGVIRVAPGTEAWVLDICDEADPEAICELAARVHRPPTLVTREGEELIWCRALLDVPDIAEAEAVLDELYERDGTTWIEWHDLTDDERIVRATLLLDGSRLEVTTHSEARMNRVLGALSDALSGARVLRDDRKPLDPGELPTPTPTSDRDEDAFEPDDEVLAQVQEYLEDRWLEESIPALGGLTPRQAAEDPTRREALVRLLASFPDPGALPGGTAMRPSRLRELLQIDD